MRHITFRTATTVTAPEDTDRTPSGRSAACRWRNELMSDISNIAHWFPAVARLRRNACGVANRIIARAHAAHQLGGTADAEHASGQELERQATRADRLLFGQAVKAFRAAAAESRLIADALDTVESGKSV